MARAIPAATTVGEALMLNCPIVGSAPACFGGEVLIYEGFRSSPLVGPVDVTVKEAAACTAPMPSTTVV